MLCDEGIEALATELEHNISGLRRHRLWKESSLIQGVGGEDDYVETAEAFVGLLSLISMEMLTTRKSNLQTEVYIYAIPGGFYFECIPAARCQFRLVL